MAGDDVSRAEWASRRKQLDTDLAEDEKAIHRPAWGFRDVKAVDDAFSKYQSDQAYKKQYSKQLGYDQPKKTVGKKPARKR